MRSMRDDKKLKISEQNDETVLSISPFFDTSSNLWNSKRKLSYMARSEF